MFREIQVQDPSVREIQVRGQVLREIQAQEKSRFRSLFFVNVRLRNKQPKVNLQASKQVRTNSFFEPLAPTSTCLTDTGTGSERDSPFPGARSVLQSVQATVITNRNITVARSHNTMRDWEIAVLGESGEWWVPGASLPFGCFR